MVYEHVHFWLTIPMLLLTSFLKTSWHTIWHSSRCRKAKWLLREGCVAPAQQWSLSGLSLTWQWHKVRWWVCTQVSSGQVVIVHRWFEASLVQRSFVSGICRPNHTQANGGCTAIRLQSSMIWNGQYVRFGGWAFLLVHQSINNSTSTWWYIWAKKFTLIYCYYNSLIT